MVNDGNDIEQQNVIKVKDVCRIVWLSPPMVLSSISSHRKMINVFFFKHTQYSVPIYPHSLERERDRKEFREILVAHCLYFAHTCITISASHSNE